MLYLLLFNFALCSLVVVALNYLCVQTVPIITDFIKKLCHPSFTLLSYFCVLVLCLSLSFTGMSSLYILQSFY